MSGYLYLSSYPNRMLTDASFILFRFNIFIIYISHVDLYWLLLIWWHHDLTLLKLYFGIQSWMVISTLCRFVITEKGSVIFFIQFWSSTMLSNGNWWCYSRYNKDLSASKTYWRSPYFILCHLTGRTRQGRGTLVNTKVIPRPRHPPIEFSGRKQTQIGGHGTKYRNSEIENQQEEIRQGNKDLYS